MRVITVSAVGLLLVTATRAAAQVPVVELDTVTASVASRASREAAATRAVEVISGEALRRFPAAGVAEAVARATGVDLMSRSPALADVAIRGSSFEQVLVLVDGVRVSDAQTGHFSLNLAVPLEQVERVEVLRGAGSALFGADAMGGVINVITRAGRDREGTSIRAESGSFGAVALAGRHARALGGLEMDVSADVLRGDGHRPGTDYEIALARAALATDLSGHRLSADIAAAARDFGANGFYAPYDSYEETRTSTATLGWEAPAGPIAVGARLSARRNTDDFILVRDDPSLYRNQHSTLQLGGEVTARHALSDAFRVAGVLEAYSDRLESESLGDREEFRSAAGLELVAGRTGSVLASAGLRADWHEAHGLVGSPSASVAWWPTRALRLRAAASRSFRTPSWTDRYYSDPANVGNPDLAPERAWTSEVGAELRTPWGVSLGATGFVRDAVDLIDWVRPAGSDGVWTIDNVESATFRGVELEARAPRLAGMSWTAAASMLSMSSSAPEGQESKYALRPITETVSLAVERPILERLRISGYARHARRRGEDAYLIVDGRAALEVAGASLYLEARNLLDASHVDITGHPAPGRSIGVGVGWGM